MFNLRDEARRQAGRALDAAGLGPQKCPSRVMAEFTGARLEFTPVIAVAATVMIVLAIVLFAVAQLASSGRETPAR